MTYLVKGKRDYQKRPLFVTALGELTNRRKKAAEFSIKEVAEAFAADQRARSNHIIFKVEREALGLGDRSYRSAYERSRY